jgi:glycosyltransferase involved in cell wall biosynthesis
MHIIKGLGRGGAENLIPSLVRNSGGHFEYSVGYFLPWKDALVRELEGHGVRVHRFSASNVPAILGRVPAVARSLRRETIDLVHCHLPVASVVSRLAGRMAGVPVVGTEHNLQERYHPIARAANVATWRLQAAVIAVSNRVAASIERHMPGSVQMAVVHNGIEVPSIDRVIRLRMRARARVGVPADSPVVGTVAVFRPQKRLDRWIDTAALVAESHPEARFLVVGDGPERAEVERRVADRGLHDALTLVGLVEDVWPLLAAMDVFFQSSDFEGLPLAVLEAMAAGLPVVATDAGGVTEAVVQGKTGFVSVTRTSLDLARQLGRILDDPALGRQLGLAGRAVVSENFSADRMAREIESIYQRVLDG